MFSKKATKIDEIFTLDLTLFSKCQIKGEDFRQIFWPSLKTRTLSRNMHHQNGDCMKSI